MISTERIIVIVGALVAVLLQVLVAPQIAYPNFLAAFCLVVALVQPNMFRYVLPFVLGLVYDLVSGGPIGAMAFTLTACCALAIGVFSRTDNDTLFMGFVVLALSVLVLEVLYGVFLLMFGFAANLLDAFAYRMLPCFLFDFVIAAILYPLASRFLTTSVPLRSEITQLH